MDMLSVEEQQRYSELFSSCDVENTGRVRQARALELFRSAQLPEEKIHQISELCGANRIGHYGRSQFYVALRMIAAAQDGLPLNKDYILTSGVRLSLPVFNTQKTSAVTTDKKKAKPRFNQRENVTEVHFQPSILLPPPTKSQGTRAAKLHERSATLPANFTLTNETEEEEEEEEKPHVYEQNVVDSDGGGSSSDSDIRPARPSPSPVSSVSSGSQRSSGSFSRSSTPEVPSVHRSLLDHQHSEPLIGSPSKHSVKSDEVDTKEWAAAFPDNAPGETANRWARFSGEYSSSKPPPPPQSAPLDRVLPGESSPPAATAIGPDQGGGSGGGEGARKASSVVSDEEDVYRITEEQHQYYTNQFKALQPNLDAMIQGAEVKEYFQKSKLSIQELAKIWELSDVNKDGALSFPEFRTAMHLVVLRKHNIEIPDVLPPSLIPQLGPTNVDEDPFLSAPDPTSPQKTVTPPAKASGPSSTGGGHWAAFTNSAYSSRASCSPTAQSPANFDFASISPDPEGKIVQPIPVRFSPESQQAVSSKDADDFRPRTFSDPFMHDGSGSSPDVDQSSATPVKPRSESFAANTGTPKKIAPPPPVDRKKVTSTPKKPATTSGDKEAAGAMAPTADRPAVPPRITKFHSVDASADEVEDLDADEVPSDFANFAKFNNNGKATVDEIDGGDQTALVPAEPADTSQHSFAPYKPHVTLQSIENDDKSQSRERHKSQDDLMPERSKFEHLVHEKKRHTSAPQSIRVDQIRADKRDIQSSIQIGQERNAMLQRANSELQQELRAVIEERIALEIQLEKLQLAPVQQQ